MGDTKEPKPVQLFCGVIFAPRAPIEGIRSDLEAAFGPIDAVSDVFQFDFTDYYRAEMGENLKKIFYAFENLISPADISGVKLKTNEIESRYAATGAQAGEGRAANLDPGYIALPKLVLATTKDFFHRIYLRDGIYAEVTLNYIKPSFTPYPWTYLDYKSSGYIGFFNELRARYKKKLEEKNI